MDFSEFDEYLSDEVDKKKLRESLISFINKTDFQLDKKYRMEDLKKENIFVNFWNHILENEYQNVKEFIKEINVDFLDNYFFWVLAIEEMEISGKINDRINRFIY